MGGWEEEEVQCPAEDVSKFVCSSDRIIKVSRPINIIFKLLAQHFAPRRQAIDISPVCLARVYKIYSWIILKQDFWMNTITLAPCRNHLFFCCLYKTQELKSARIFSPPRDNDNERSFVCFHHWHKHQGLSRGPRWNLHTSSAPL